MKNNSNDFNNDFFDNLIKRAKEANPVKPEDYIDEKTGLLFCGNCKTPKRAYIDFLGKKTEVPVVCKCEKEKEEEEREREKEQNRLAFVEKAKNACFPSELYSEMTFENSDSPERDSEARCREYAEDFDVKKSRGLVLYGSPGTGKSFLAASICNAIIKKGFSALFTDVMSAGADLVSVVKEDREKAEEKLNYYDLVVFDDFGMDRQTDYVLDGIQKAIVYRYNSGKPLIITTNITGDQFKNPKDVRLRRVFSRLFERCDFIELSGADRRINKLIERERQRKRENNRNITP